MSYSEAITFACIPEVQDSSALGFNRKSYSFEVPYPFQKQSTIHALPLADSVIFINRKFGFWITCGFTKRRAGHRRRVPPNLTQLRNGRRWASRRPFHHGGTRRRPYRSTNPCQTERTLRSTIKWPGAAVPSSSCPGYRCTRPSG